MGLSCLLFRTRRSWFFMIRISDNRCQAPVLWAVFPVNKSGSPPQCSRAACWVLCWWTGGAATGPRSPSSVNSNFLKAGLVVTMERFTDVPRKLFAWNLHSRAHIDFVSLTAAGFIIPGDVVTLTLAWSIFISWVNKFAINCNKSQQLLILGCGLQRTPHTLALFCSEPPIRPVKQSQGSFIFSEFNPVMTAEFIQITRCGWKLQTLNLSVFSSIFFSTYACCWF